LSEGIDINYSGKNDVARKNPEMKGIEMVTLKFFNDHDKVWHTLLALAARH